jgi:hypothetical protein
MSMTLADLRGYVRTQTETTTAELPDATVDIYLREAFDRTIALENQWPFFEETWDLVQSSGGATITFPTDAHLPGIVGLYHVDDDYRVELVSHSVAREFFGEFVGNASTGAYTSFSVWDGLIYLWPAMLPTVDIDWQLTGFRRPTDWIASGASTEPDCDERLHRPLAHYATALAYAQQEDLALEAQYMKRWELDVMTARAAIMEPAQDRPLIMGPHRWSRINPTIRRPYGIVSLP